ncbi:DUF1360 domain-containing protein [Shouchella patagoniensis]|uniref:DUF1360 domain-containing protein n=1 Tax=Shouchella patagoniensis TaxID=228576 RepID=UPI00099524F0|nr:DUF1360 domain-containing protein [Shouchella patagoniensis]
MELGELNLVTLLILGLAVFRLTYLIISDVITAPIRGFFVEEIEETDSRGRMTHYTMPKMPFSRAIIGTLITCPWCISVWIGALLVIAWNLWPTVTILISLVFALSGVAGFMMQLNRLVIVNTYSPSKKQLQRMEEMKEQFMGKKDNNYTPDNKEVKEAN